MFNKYVDDPSNEDEIFKRVRIRNLIKNLESEGLDKVNLNYQLII